LQASTFKEVKLLMNKAVAKVHERLVRERAKTRGDDRDLRMQALKANDMAAYQEMLRAQFGSTAAQDARYAFLCSTHE
jgi:SWI/SNF-related matrix-associated actin-dependent regulator of chromatin subfamily A protein 2/4